MTTRWKVSQRNASRRRAPLGRQGRLHGRRRGLPRSDVEQLGPVPLQGVRPAAEDEPARLPLGVVQEALDQLDRGAVAAGRVGMESAAHPDVRSIRLAPHDRLLLCTDGLTGMVSNSSITDVLQATADPEAACQALVRAANDAGGQDNITVIVLERLGTAT